jgi:2-polyprenyl-3-methyl-5-hydroxy-6-metoxy-1,4-benzoquinol methylase
LTNLSVQDGQEFALDQEFDTVVLGEVIEHVTNPGGLLASAARHLKPTGRIVLTTPYVFGINNVLYALAKFPKTCSNPEHVQWFCPSTMAELAERHGLSVSTWHLCAAYAHPNRPLVAIFYLLMRTLGKLLPKRISATSMVFVLARENPGC